MSDRLPTPVEQEFLQATGLDANNLAPLVADAAALPADALARIRTRARLKAGLAPAPPEAQVLPHATVRWAALRHRWWIGAAASLLFVGGTLFVTNPEGAMAAIQRMARLVPGIGLTATDAQTLIMLSPVSAESGGERLTVTGLISDGEKTELRYLIEGLPEDKVRPSGNVPPSKPSLHLADGTVLESTGSAGWGGLGTLSGILWFAPLPSGTTELTLSLPSIHGITQPFQIAIPVVDAGEAGLAEASLGGWSGERLGIRVGVPYWTTQGDRIVLNLEASLPEGTQVEEIGEQNDTLQFEPVLTDEQGRIYPLIPEESELRLNTGDHLSATFRGPIAPDAGSLRLSVPVLRVSETARAELSIPLTRIPIGEPLRLDEQFRIGSRSFAVNTVTRVDEETFRFDLDLGPEQNGALLQELHIGPKRGTFSGGGSWSSSSRLNPETWQMDWIDYNPEEPPDGNLELVFERPVVRLHGGWEVELPERADGETDQP